MALPALRPAEPRPTEVANWHAGKNTARQQYDAMLASNELARRQATNRYGLQQSQLNYNQGNQRQTFDDPYIGRGIFNSGIRAKGLNQFHTDFANQGANIGMDYSQTMQRAYLGDTNAQNQYNTTVGNIALQEAARRTEEQMKLADLIKGIG